MATDRVALELELRERIADELHDLEDRLLAGLIAACGDADLRRFWPSAAAALDVEIKNRVDAALRARASGC